MHAFGNDGFLRDDVLTWQEYYEIPAVAEATPTNPPVAVAATATAVAAAVGLVVVRVQRRSQEEEGEEEDLCNNNALTVNM